MKALSTTMVLAIVVLLGVLVECQQRRVYKCEQALKGADSVMWMADSIVGTTNTGTLDDPDSVCAEWMNKRCKFNSLREEALTY